MITEQDLKAAIAECQGVKNPNASTCVKLASFMTIYDHMFNEDSKETQPISQYSFSSGNNISTSGDSEFESVIDGKDINGVVDVLTELMETLQILNPRLYNSVIQKLREAG